MAPEKHSKTVKESRTSRSNFKVHTRNAYETDMQQYCSGNETRLLVYHHV